MVRSRRAGTFDVKGHHSGKAAKGTHKCSLWAAPLAEMVRQDPSFVIQLTACDTAGAIPRDVSAVRASEIAMLVENHGAAANPVRPPYKTKAALL